MLKVMVIDDEPLVREGVKTVIDWEKYGYCICGEGIDGIDGLNKMEKLSPDLVLVDIKMPEMDGLEVIRKAREKGFRCKFIILTGYSDFSYTKKAIQLGVNSYLLKPVEEDELVEIVKKLRETIYEEREILSYVNNGRRHLQENVIKSIVRGSVMDEDLESYLKNLNPTSYSSYQTALIAKTSGKEPTGSAADIFDMVSGLLKNTEKSCLLFEIEGRTGIVFYGMETSRSKRSLQRLYKQIKEQTQDEIYISLGRRVEDGRDIRLSYNDAVEILNNKFFFEPSEVVAWEECCQNNILSAGEACGQKVVSINIPQFIEKLYAAVEAGAGHRMDEAAAEFFDVLKQRKYPEFKIKGLCTNILNEIVRRALEHYAVLKDTVPSSERVMSEVYDKVSFSQLVSYFTLQINSLAESITNLESNSIILKIKNYIEKNYDKDLTLEMLGDLFGYNSGYLGKLFRSCIGEPFNAYLEKVRIENANALLLKGYKVYEVTQKTGFQNVDYFYYKFKKHVGVSTSDFKKGWEMNRAT